LCSGSCEDDGAGALLLLDAVERTTVAWPGLAGTLVVSAVPAGGGLAACALAGGTGALASGTAALLAGGGVLEATGAGVDATTCAALEASDREVAVPVDGAVVTGLAERSGSRAQPSPGRLAAPMTAITSKTPPNCQWPRRIICAPEAILLVSRSNFAASARGAPLAPRVAGEPRSVRGDTRLVFGNVNPVFCEMKAVERRTETIVTERVSISRKTRSIWR
jgi:hypothetical protein